MMAKRTSSIGAALDVVVSRIRTLRDKSGVDKAGAPDPKEALLALLRSKDWKLTPKKELELMEPALRATYAYAFGIEVRDLSYLSLSGQLLRAHLPTFLGSDSAHRIVTRMEYAFANVAEDDRLAARLISEKDKPILQEIFNDTHFDASVQFLLTEVHGPIAAGASKTVATALREHAFRLASAPEAAPPIKNLIDSFAYALPLMRHERQKGTLVVLCG